jgi:hypothetical protein
MVAMVGKETGMKGEKIILHHWLWMMMACALIADHSMKEIAEFIRKIPAFPSSTGPRRRTGLPLPGANAIPLASCRLEDWAHRSQAAVRLPG